MSILKGMYFLLRGLAADRTRLAAENLALRQQLAVLKRGKPRQKVRRWDRIF